MAYNLRTGLIGSGDIDVNVSLTGITADNITSGTFDQARIPTLGDSKISDLDANKLTGTVALAQIPTLDDSKISSLSAVKLTGTISTNRIPDLQASKIAYGELDAARIPSLDATKITTGTFASADRIPTLPSSKIDATTTFAKSMINSAGEWSTSDIPDLSANKITSDNVPSISSSHMHISDESSERATVI